MKGEHADTVDGLTSTSSATAGKPASAPGPHSTPKARACAADHPLSPEDRANRHLTTPTRRHRCQTVVPIFASAAALMVVLGAQAQAQDVLRVAISTGYPPFNVLNADGTFGGFDVDYACSCASGCR